MSKVYILNKGMKSANICGLVGLTFGKAGLAYGMIIGGCIGIIVGIAKEVKRNNDEIKRESK